MPSALMLIALLAPEDAGATYELGGPRRVVAVVRDAGDEYEMRVRMLAVTAFDDATNARLNRLKAEHFALQGLARHLSRDKKARFELSGGRVVTSAKDGKSFTLTFRVPRKAVVLLRADAPEKPGRVRFAFDTPFFTRKRDLIETGKQLAESLRADLAAAEKKVTKAPASVEAFLVRVAELEEASEKHWKRLRAEVGADRFLLTLERDEVLAAVKRQQADWGRALESAAKRYAGGDAR